MIYFISDTHFGHKGSLNWPNGHARNFKDVEEMNQYIIDKWNSIVTDEDEVYFLGDFAYKCNMNKALSIFYQLNGKKHLIRGNHDKKLADKFNNHEWESISDIKRIDYTKDNGCNQMIILCHYPIHSWDGKFRGSIHLHGHTHLDIPDIEGKIMNVSCEAIDYTPISIVDIIKRFENET